MKKIILLLAAALVIVFSSVSCGSDINVQQFIDKAHSEKRSVDPQKQQEINKSIFPKLKENN
ncbi:MAG: hypothetical protein Q8920_12115 [Bacillota bacterium]|nr:hypothetical protein [Bacillota bacterium]